MHTILENSFHPHILFTTRVVCCKYKCNRRKRSLNTFKLINLNYFYGVSSWKAGIVRTVMAASPYTLFRYTTKARCRDLWACLRKEVKNGKVCDVAKTFFMVISFQSNDLTPAHCPEGLLHHGTDLGHPTSAPQSFALQGVNSRLLL